MNCNLTAIIPELMVYYANLESGNLEGKLYGEWISEHCAGCHDCYVAFMGIENKPSGVVQ